MSRMIYTYTDLERISESPFYSEIKALPQITVTTDLRKGINWYPKTHSGKRLFYSHARDFGEVFDEICPEWNTTTEIFAQTVTLAEFFRERISNSADEATQKYYRGFKRNCGLLVKAINGMEEACVSCEDVRNAADTNRDVLTMCDAWEYLYEENRSIYEMHYAIERLSEKGRIKRLLDKLFGNFAGNKIVIHGFYYISSLQERIFAALEKAGYTLIFLFPYHNNYPVAMEPWDKAYVEYRGYPGKDSWVMSGSPIYNIGGELLEGRMSSKVSANIQVMSYRNVIEFAQAMKQVKENGEIYSSNATQANQILKEIYPERFGERRLLSYPVGQFLVSLHSMWDEEAATIILSPELLKECFASGWISTGGVSSIEYLRDLDLILPYFEDCHSYLDWESRIDHLRLVYENALQPFYDNVAEIENVRVAETAGNPLLKFGMFSIEPSRLFDILDIIAKQISMAKELFYETKDTSIASHMSKLEKMLSMEIDLSGKTDEEIVVVTDLMGAVSSLKRKKIDCYVDDIVTAMRIYLNRQDDEETPSEQIGMVYPLSQIDAAPIKHGSKIHICMCDMANMPGTVKSYTWPLNKRTVELCLQRTQNPLLGLIVENHELAAVYNRYYFFSACNNSDLEFSWIEQINQKRNPPSPYISLLASEGVQIKSLLLEKLSREAVSQEPIASETIENSEPTYYNPEQDMKDMKMEYAVCPMRYLYGFVLDAHPKFSNTFQHSRAIGGLITALTNIMREERLSKAKIADEVFALFPNLRNVEKQQIIDYLGLLSPAVALPDEYAEYEFTSERFNVVYPDEDLRESARLKYSELGSQLARQGINLYEPTDVKKACMFCPHEAYCRNCIYAVDQGDYYD